MDLLEVLKARRQALATDESELVATATDAGKVAPAAQKRLDAIHLEITQIDAQAATEAARQQAVREAPAVMVESPMGSVGSGFGSGLAMAYAVNGARPDWGAAFVQARQSQGRYGAALLEAGSTAVQVPLRPDPIADARRAKFLFELLPELPAPNGTYSYMKQSLRELAAAVVEPGARKPVSHFSLERANDTTEVIAHITDPINRFDIEDAPMLQQFVNDELALGVNLALDELVYAALLDDITPGSGTLNLAGIRSAITALQLLEMEPSAIAINPTDWQAVEAEAVTTFAANSNAPAATEALKRFLYGVPVTVTNALDDGTAIVGDFAGSAAVYITGDVRIDVTNSFYKEDIGDGNPGSTFETNQLVFRGERRANAAIGRPAGFILVGTVPGS